MDDKISVNEVKTWSLGVGINMIPSRHDHRIMLHRKDGGLLRSFDVKEGYVDARDFRNWKRFMGYDI